LIVFGYNGYTKNTETLHRNTTQLTTSAQTETGEEGGRVRLRGGGGFTRAA